MLARLLLQTDKGRPRLRWAIVDHAGQLALSRMSLCQGQKLSYSCVSLSALDKTASPYCCLTNPLNVRPVCVFAYIYIYICLLT